MEEQVSSGLTVLRVERGLLLHDRAAAGSLNAGSIELAERIDVKTGVLFESSKKQVRILFGLLDIEGSRSNNDCDSDGHHSTLRSKSAGVARPPMAYLGRTAAHKRWAACSSTSSPDRARQSILSGGIDRSG